MSSNECKKLSVEKPKSTAVKIQYLNVIFQQNIARLMRKDRDLSDIAVYLSSYLNNELLYPSCRDDKSSLIQNKNCRYFSPQRCPDFIFLKKSGLILLIVK